MCKQPSQTYHRRCSQSARGTRLQPANMSGELPGACVMSLAGHEALNCSMPLMGSTAATSKMHISANARTHRVGRQSIESPRYTANQLQIAKLHLQLQGVGMAAGHINWQLGAGVSLGMAQRATGARWDSACCAAAWMPWHMFLCLLAPEWNQQGRGSNSRG